MAVGGHGATLPQSPFRDAADPRQIDLAVRRRRIRHVHGGGHLIPALSDKSVGGDFCEACAKRVVCAKAIHQRRLASIF